MPYIEPGTAWEYAFEAGASGETWVEVSMAAPGTSWACGEAAVVALDVDGTARQEVILAGGDDHVDYRRLLGRLSGGTHLLRLWIDIGLSAPPTSVVEIGGIRTGTVPDDHPASAPWRHAPILHYRDLDGPLDSVSTDAPLLLFYRPITGADLSADPRGGAGAGGRATGPCRGLEYHVVFSHEDSGTDVTGLLAKWGHTTDIEWVYRALWDTSGTIAREEYQGPDHRALPFRGARALGGHPVLQVSGRHGMVTDRVSCPFRAALAPVWDQPADEPREGVMHRFPWTYRVSALEVARQVTLEPVPDPRSPAPADPRAYLFLQWKRLTPDPGPLEAAVWIGEHCYTSAWGRADLAFEGEDAESTAVKLPPDASEDAIGAIAIRSVARPAAPLEVRLVRAFLLNGAYEPRPPLAVSGTATLRVPGEWTIVWDRRRASAGNTILEHEGHPRDD